MKENVLIGKLLPVGTGMKRYRDIKLDSDLNQFADLDFDDEFADYADYEDGGIADTEEMAEVPDDAVVAIDIIGSEE